MGGRNDRRVGAGILHAESCVFGCVFMFRRVNVAMDAGAREEAYSQLERKIKREAKAKIRESAILVVVISVFVVVVLSVWNL